MCTPTPSTGIPLHEHGAFDDIAVSLRGISLAANALRGIGTLMQPEHTRADEQLNMARRSHAAAVFEFFGEVIMEHYDILNEATDRVYHEALQLTQGEQSC